MMSNEKRTLKGCTYSVDMSQGDLAEKVGVTRQTIGLIELGKYNSTLLKH